MPTPINENAHLSILLDPGMPGVVIPNLKFGKIAVAIEKIALYKSTPTDIPPPDGTLSRAMKANAVEEWLALEHVQIKYVRAAKEMTEFFGIVAVVAFNPKRFRRFRLYNSNARHVIRAKWQNLELSAI